MKSTYYSTAWTDSGFLLGCSHEHETIVEANSCISCAGGYVVGVENGVMRSLTEEEESEFQRAHHAPRTDNPVPDTTVPVAAKKASRVLRILDAYGLDQYAEPLAEGKHEPVDPNLLGLMLIRLSKWEITELERMCAADKHALLRALQSLFRATHSQRRLDW